MYPAIGILAGGTAFIITWLVALCKICCLCRARRPINAEISKTMTEMKLKIESITYGKSSTKVKKFNELEETTAQLKKKKRNIVDDDE